jgi:hypothetical protein
MLTLIIPVLQSPGAHFSNKKFASHRYLCRYKNLFKKQPCANYKACMAKFCYFSAISFLEAQVNIVFAELKKYFYKRKPSKVSRE